MNSPVTPPASMPMVRIVPISRRRSLMLIRRLMKIDTAMMNSMIAAIRVPTPLTAFRMLRARPRTSSMVARVSRTRSRPSLSSS